MNFNLTSIRLWAAITISTISFNLDAASTNQAAESARVVQAHRNKDKTVSALLAAQTLDSTAINLYLRAFKDEAELEVWGKNSGEQSYRLIKTYPVCAASGVLGPKLKQGDRQVPEGFYRIDRFNPYSSFHLSLGIDYPNGADRLRGGKRNLGGDIFIHGDCVSIGCLAMRDEAIEEIYLLALAAKRPIPVHIFPARLDDKKYAWLSGKTRELELRDFWKTLKPAYQYFEQTHRLPKITIDKQGHYNVAAEQQP